MTSEQASRSRRSNGEHKGIRHKIKGFFGHRKNAMIPQAGSQVAQPEEGSSNDSELLQPSKSEISLGNSLNCQKSTLATGQETGQERHPPLTQHGHNKDVIAIEDAKNSKDLWLQAYEALELREPDLVAAYKRRLAPTSTNSADPSLSPELIETIINSNLQDREADQWVVNLDKKSVKVQEQSEKVIKFVFWFNDIVSEALSA